MESVTNTTLNTEVIDKGRWQYQSNTDAFSKSEEPKWEFYSLEDNFLIEDAYYHRHEKVELKDYVINIKHMIQTKKGDAIKQRRIRRIDWKDCIEEMDRSERYLETEKPKTINKIFGRLGDFLGFFAKRSPEVLRLKSQLAKMEKLDDLESLNQEILPKLVFCLEKLVRPILEQSKPSLFQKKRIKRHEQLVRLFKEEVASFKEFYGRVLKAYTMNTCLYENLNKYLRNESWGEVDKLMPYAFCLCKAFFHLNLFQEKEEIEISSQKEDSNMLYRGTAFDESALDCYRNKMAEKYFSWNCVTSTTTSKKVAEDFMYGAGDLKNGKYPVLFIIEMPITNDNRDPEYLEWLDIERYSDKKEEKEVILPPGSVFEIIEITTDENKRTIIQLKLKNEIKSLAHGGLIMQGTLQNQMMTGTKLRIVSLKGEDLFDTLKSHANNELIEKVEFCLCTFNQEALRLMMSTLPTLKKAKELKFVSCVYNDQNKMLEAISKEIETCNISKVKFYESEDFCELMSAKNKNNVNWISFRILNITFKGESSDETINHVLQKIKHLTQLISLTLDFSRYGEITDGQLHRLAAQDLRNLIRLRSLSLNFSTCKNITNEGIRMLASQRLRYLTLLTSLTLNFSDCPEVTWKGLWRLSSEGLRFLTRLKSLTLDFSNCSEITDGGIHALSDLGLSRLIQLRSLTLHFSACQTSDEGLESLAIQALRYLTQLNLLSLDFSIYQEITEDGLESLASQALRHLTNLTCLTLDFSCCSNVTYEGVIQLIDEGLIYLTQLASLTLIFLDCDRITEEEMESLECEISNNLPQLTCLLNDTSHKSLQFKSIDDDDEMEQAQQEMLSLGERKLVFRRVLENEQPQCLEELISLTLDFSWAWTKGIKDEEMIRLLHQRIQNPAQLQCLTLKFEWGFLRDNEMSQLASQLRNLIRLESLTLNFFYCSNITNKGLSHLGSKGLRHLTQLKHLTLNLSSCHKITDNGIHNLFSEGIIYLSQLESLTLLLDGSEKVADRGVNPLSYELLSHLEKLSLFTLGFSGCDLISDSALESTARVFEYLGFEQSH